MSSKSFEEIQSFINKSIISLIERNDTFGTWLNSNQYQINVTISYTHLPHYKQIGPTCGLTALLMIKDYYNKYQNNEILNREDKKEEQDILTNINNQKEFSERLSDILNIAIKKKFTNKGEMFWSRGMALLLKNYCGLKCKILKFQNNPSNNVYIKKPLTDMKRNTSINNINYNVNDEKRNISNDQYNFSLLDYHLKNKISEDNFQKISQTIIKNLLKNNLCLIPYDKDCNNEPCFKQGHKAHWCIINGFIIVEPIKIEQNIELDEISKFNIIWNNTEVSKNSKIYLESHLNNLYFICTHSGSSYPGLFKAEQLLKSNSQLNEVAPAVIKETKETIYHNFYKNTNSNKTDLDTVNSNSKISPLTSSIPMSPSPQVLNNDNDFTNLKVSSVKFSVLNQCKTNAPLNSCQKTQKDRKGYIIPNFYSFPKKNVYNWEQYQANLRKDLFLNKNHKISSNIDSINNYQGHSLKETLCSSIILVGQNDYFYSK